jgi:SAM-dependent methyltransferase
LVDQAGFGLEIGPSHNPVFPKREGFNVEILDYADEVALVQKYLQLGVDPTAIEKVDYVSNGAMLHEVIPRRAEYDFIFSSHAIEHVTDFIGYIKSCELLLKPGGVIAMAVPDKRYTFDIFQPITTTGRVLEAFYRNSARHSGAAVYDFIANFAEMDGKGVWTKYDVGTLAFPHSIEGARTLLEDTMRNDGPYHDVHGWVFTPNSFRLILHDLKALGLIQVEEYHMHEEGALEFHVGLAVGAPGHGYDRMALQKRVAHELLISSSQILAPDDVRLKQIFEELRPV